LVVRPPSSLGKQASFALTRFLIAFCIGVAATLAWQSYGDAVRKMTASSSPRLVGSSAPQAAPEAATRGIEAGGFVVQLSAQRYQSGVLIVGYSYGYFEARDLLHHRGGVRYPGAAGAAGNRAAGSAVCSGCSGA
jgi:hypothetical protein